MVKWPKKRVFGIFDPNNLMQQKIDPAYHVGNFPISFFKKKKNVSVKLSFDVNMTSQSRDFWPFL